MGMGYKTGGAGSELSFRVAAYSTEQAMTGSTPSGCTLGIVTTDPVTGWSIRGTEPENPSLGHLWIRTGASGPGALNALLHNALVICPIGAKQWTGEAWADRVGKTYLGGWKNWEEAAVYLYRAWDQNPALTGGWVGTDGCLDTGSGALRITAQVFGGSVSYGAAYTASAVDLTAWSRVRVTVTAVDGRTDSERYFALFREIPTGQPGEDIASRLLLSVPVTGTGSYTLDLSGITGAYRVGFYAKGYEYSHGSLTAGEIILEKEVLA